MIDPTCVTDQGTACIFPFVYNVRELTPKIILVPPS